MKKLISFYPHTLYSFHMFWYLCSCGFSFVFKFFSHAIESTEKAVLFLLIPFHSTLLSYVSVRFCVYLIAIEFVFLYNVSCLHEISQSKLVGIVLFGSCILIGRCKGKDFRWLNPISLQFSSMPRHPFSLYFFFLCHSLQLAVCNLRRKPSVQR